MRNHRLEKMIPQFYLICFRIGQFVKNTVMRKMNGLITVMSVSCSISLLMKSFHLLIHLFLNGNTQPRGSLYWVFTQHWLHFKTKTRRAIQHTLTTEPLSLTVWLSHQRIQLGSLLLIIITLNKVAFLFLYHFVARSNKKKDVCLCIQSFGQDGR